MATIRGEGSTKNKNLIVVLDTATTKKDADGKDVSKYIKYDEKGDVKGYLLNVQIDQSTIKNIEKADPQPNLVPRYGVVYYSKEQYDAMRAAGKTVDAEGLEVVGINADIVPRYSRDPKTGKTSTIGFGVDTDIKTEEGNYELDPSKISKTTNPLFGKETLAYQLKNTDAAKALAKEAKAKASAELESAVETEVATPEVEAEVEM